MGLLQKKSFHKMIFHDVKNLDKSILRDIYNIWKKNVETKYSIDQFEKIVIHPYDSVAAFTEPETGDLKGYALNGIIRNKSYKGRHYTLLQQAAAFRDPQYRAGTSPANLMMTRVILKESILHPFTPLYATWKIFSVKGYLLGIRVLGTNVYPNCDSAVPLSLKGILDEYGRRFGGELYDSEMCVIKQEDIRMKEHLGDIQDKELQNQHVEFFKERNPNWKKGHMLCTITSITWPLVFRFFIRQYFNW